MRGRQGFTLVESLIAASILAMAIGAITMPFLAAAQNDEAGARLAVATGVAEALMEEIVSRPVTDPDGLPEALGSPRTAFDDVMDYNALTEAEGQLCSASGALLSEPIAGGLTRTATVQSVFLPGQAPEETPFAIRVTVTVAYRNQPIVTLSRLLQAGGS